MLRKFLLFGIAMLVVVIINDPGIIQYSTNSGFNFSGRYLSSVIGKKKTKHVWEYDKKNDAVDTSALKQSNWYANVIRNIEASEYNINKDNHSGNYSAANRAQQLKGIFITNGFTLQSQEENNHWKLGLQLSGIYADQLLYAKPGDSDPATTDSNKVVFNNTQFNTEYINSKAGIRQNFIIKNKPANNPKTLQLRLQTNGNWYVDKAHDHELHFAKMNGEKLTSKIIYNSLKVWDANNKELVARFVVNKKHTGFEIEVNAADAVYPVTIDPISTTPSTTLNGLVAGAHFGWSVASAGDVNGDGYSDVIIGTYWVSAWAGAAYIYYGSSTGLSTSPGTTLNGPFLWSYFGTSVASAGDVNGDGYSDVIVGAFQGASYGAAYVYLGSSTGLATSPATTLNSVLVAENLGWCVASAGDINGDGYSDVIVGNNSGTTVAVVRVYMGSATGLSATPATTLTGVPADKFGSCISGAGDVNGDGYSDIIVGAYGFDSNRGAAYIYMGSATGLSATPATTLNGISGGDYFGNSVSYAGDVNGDGYSDIIVGAYGVATYRGATYVFLGSNTGLSATPSNTINGVNPSDAFGWSVSCAGDVNGDGYSDVVFYGVSASIGSAYVYSGSSFGLSASPLITLNGTLAGDRFGTSVSSAGDVNGDGYSDILIGASGVSSNTGAAYIFLGRTDVVLFSPNAIIHPVIIGDPFANVASAGDVNSDGYSDVIVGAWQASGSTGVAYLFLGSAYGLPSTPSLTLNGSTANDKFGTSVASAGDVNGDGYSDVIVGANGVSSGTGAAYIFLGSISGLSTTADYTLNGFNLGDAFGYSVAGAGDVNADGYSDVVVGAYGFSSGKGAAYLFLGSSAGPSTTPATTLTGYNSSDFFGTCVANAGDIDGDGYCDVIIGARGVSALRGAAYLFKGSNTGLLNTPATIMNGVSAGDNFGVRVASAGDVNGDGYSDAIVGANNAASGDGKVYLFLGNASGLSGTPSTILNAISTGLGFGAWISSAGDINGDGYSDVIIGCSSLSSNGNAYLYLGSNTGLATIPARSLTGIFPGDHLGLYVACAGDITGDGYSDLILGVPGLGAAYIYYGNYTNGIRNNLRLYNTDLTTPVSHLNFNDPNLFGAGLFAKSPLGRVKGKLVWEVKKQGFSFSGNPITNSTSYFDKQTSFTDLGIAGIELKNNVQKQGMQTKIRARVQYDKATAITGQVYGPWRYPAAYLQGAHGMNSIPLPVKLTEFTTALISEKVETQWTVADDENVSSYQVERSADNLNFTSIGMISSLHQNNSNYHFTDQHPLKGRSWYRLHIMDNNNRIGYSKTVLIKNILDGLNVYPTVLNKGESINLQLGKQLSGNMDIQMLNSAGVMVFRKAIKVNSGGIYSLTLPALPAGVYVLSVLQLGEKMLTQKIVIQ